MLSSSPICAGNFPFAAAAGRAPSAESTPLASSLSQQPVDKRKSDTMLDIYIYDYLRKRNLVETAGRFLDEAGIEAGDSVKAPIDISQGFLYEWWTVFWDFYNARASKPSSNEAISFLNTMKQMTHVQNAQKTQNSRVNSASFSAQGKPTSSSPPTPQSLQQQQYTPDPAMMEPSAFQQLQQQYQQQQKLSQAHQQQQNINAYRMQILAGQQQQQQQQILNQQHQAHQAALQQQSIQQSQQRTPSQTVQSQLAVLLTQHLAQMGISNNQFNGLPASQKQVIIRRVMASSNLNAVPSPSNPHNVYSPVPQQQQQQFQQISPNSQHGGQQGQQMANKRPRMDDKPMQNQQQPQFKSMEQMQQFQRMAAQKQHMQQLKSQQQPIPQLGVRQNSIVLETQSPQSAPIYQQQQQQQMDSNVLYAANISDDLPEKSRSASLTGTTDFRDFLNANNNQDKIEEDFDVAYLNSLDPSQPIDFGTSNSATSSSNSFNNSANSSSGGGSGGLAGMVSESLTDAKEWNDAEVESWLNLDA